MVNWFEVPTQRFQENVCVVGSIQLTVQLHPQVIQLSDALPSTFVCRTCDELGISRSTVAGTVLTGLIVEAPSDWQMVLLNQLGLQLPKWQIL